MAVLSNNTDWSRIERIRADLAELFSDFSLKSYAELPGREIGDRILPWFLERKAGAMTLQRDLVNLRRSARRLYKHSRLHGTAESYLHTAGPSTWRRSQESGRTIGISGKR